MNSSESVTDEMPDVIVNLNISEINITINGSKARTFMKTPNEDTSINNIILGIGAVVVILICLLIIIKLIHKCYKLCKEANEDVKDLAKSSPLLPSSSPRIVARKPSIRNPSASIRRSSLPIQTQLEIREKRLSQIYDHTPPSGKKS